MGERGPPDSWRPLLLPRLDLGPADTDVLEQCRGERPLASFAPADREAIERARQEGLIALAPPPSEARGTRMIVISPHPDDAVLSIGAALAGARGTVIDVFSRETWSPRPFYARRPELTRRTILDEERASCLILGAEPVFLDFPDAPLRGVAPFAADTVDPGLVRGVADVLRNLIGGDDAPLYVPLGIGRHVDHLVCRSAVAGLVQDGTIAPDRLRYYEDLPYAALPRPAPPPAIDSTTAEIRLASPHDAMAKAEAIRAYHVQLRTGVLRRVLAHGAAIGERGLLGERFWRCDREARPTR